MSAPTFRTEVHIEAYEDVEITAKELEREGWVYVGKGNVGAIAETVLDVVERWHYASHTGPWRFCPELPCDELRGRPHDGRDR